MSYPWQSFMHYRHRLLFYENTDFKSWFGHEFIEYNNQSAKICFSGRWFNATRLDNFFFQYHLYCFKFGRQFDSDVSNNPRNFRRISKEFYCSWNFLSEALSKTQFGWSQSSKILRLCKNFDKGLYHLAGRYCTLHV